jgi:hypothetical protein
MCVSTKTIHPGESLPVELVTEATDAAHALHSHNMAFASALVVEGTWMVSVLDWTGRRVLMLITPC